MPDANEDLRMNRDIYNRRTFVGAVAGLTAAGVVSPLIVSAEDEADSPELPSIKSPVKLIEDRDLQLFRVRLAVSAKGNVDIASDPLVSRKSETKLPITSEAVFDYEERYRYPRGAAKDSPVIATERFYHEAASDSTLNKKPQSFSLRDDIRSTIVRRDMLPETIYSNDGHFTHEELGLIRTPVSGVSLGMLLPSDAVMPGDTYTPSDEAIASLLNLTSYDAGEQSCSMETIDAETAKIKLTGKVDGSVDGVPTLIRYVGKLTFDRQTNTCSWLALAVHETRDIGKAEPGFDVSATMRMIRQPMAKPVGLSARAANINMEAPIPGEKAMVMVTSDRLQFTSLVDRRWWMMKDVAGAAMMRMIESESSLGQCNLKPLVMLPEGKQWTLEAFEKDVRDSMKDQPVKFIQANQRMSAQGARVLQLTAAGKTEGVDIRWVFQHFSDDNGRRMLATFVSDARSFPTMSATVDQFAETLRFTTPKPTVAPKESTEKTAQPDVASSKSTKARVSRRSADSQPSASDRR